MIDYGDGPLYAISRTPIDSDAGRRLVAKAVSWKWNR